MAAWLRSMVCDPSQTARESTVQRCGHKDGGVRLGSHRWWCPDVTHLLFLALWHEFQGDSIWVRREETTHCGRAVGTAGPTRMGV
jgi:hypothetical protein